MRSNGSRPLDGFNGRLIARRPTAGRLSAAVGLLSLGLLLLAGCQLGGGQTTAAHATPPPAPSFPPLSTTTPASLPQGASAIRPHLSAIPAFTTQDMAQYVTSHPLPGSSGTPSITRNVFLSSQDVAQRIGVPVGRAATALLGYVELHGSFAFPSLQGGAPFTYAAASEVFDAQTGNLLMYGGLQAPTPTPTPTPTVLTATPTATPTPVVKFTVQPISFTQSCGPTSSPLPGLSVTLDSMGSTIAVSWSVQISDQDPNHTAVWASASPTAGTTPAGGAAHVTITPAPDLCARFGSTTTPIAFHATVTWTTAGGGTATITDTVHPYVIG